MMNFLSNAIRFTNSEGKITVKINVISHQIISPVSPEMYVNLQISIIDTGFGMTEEGLSHMFMDFGKL